MILWGKCSVIFDNDNHWSCEECTNPCQQCTRTSDKRGMWLIKLAVGMGMGGGGRVGDGGTLEPRPSMFPPGQAESLWAATPFPLYRLRHDLGIPAHSPLPPFPPTPSHPPPPVPIGRSVNHLRIREKYLIFSSGIWKKTKTTKNRLAKCRYNNRFLNNWKSDQQPTRNC